MWDFLSASAVINLARNRPWPSVITYHWCVGHTTECTSIEPNSLSTVFSVHALRFTFFFKYKMETESESGTSGDDSVFWLDSEVVSQETDSEEGEREGPFR